MHAGSRLHAWQQAARMTRRNTFAPPRYSRLAHSTAWTSCGSTCRRRSSIYRCWAGAVPLPAAAPSTSLHARSCATRSHLSAGIAPRPARQPCHACLAERHAASVVCGLCVCCFVTPTATYRWHCAWHYPSVEPLARCVRTYNQIRGVAHEAAMLCRLACAGLPEGARVRARVWQLLLGYLPPDSQQWAETLSKRRAEYKSFCRDFMVKPDQSVQTLHVLHLKTADLPCLLSPLDSAQVLDRHSMRLRSAAARRYMRATQTPPPSDRRAAARRA